MFNFIVTIITIILLSLKKSELTILTTV